MSIDSSAITEPLTKTPLAAQSVAVSALCAYQGAQVAKAFSDTEAEITALTGVAGIYDLGYRAYLRITGSDRIRWLNGMVTNTIQALAEGHWNYSLLLNAQGRIQGDANVYRTTDDLIFQTNRSQLARLSAHLDHFIIMDDVELSSLDASWTTIGVAGPKSETILAQIGLPVPAEGAFSRAIRSGTELTIVYAHSPLVPRFEIWTTVTALPELWAALQAAGATPCGIAATEALRVLEATPLYGTDIQEKHLAQETSQTRALNFNKGCYLGQEIVERIRSRATVHRTLRQFSVEHAELSPGQTIELNAEGAEHNPVGELSSLAHLSLPLFTGTLALGFIRTEAVERKLLLTHTSGTATVLDAPPAI